VRLQTYGGTAICDFFATMAADVDEFAPDVVVMEFSGNAITGCVNHEPFTPTAWYDRYHADADAVMALYERHGIPVYWVSAPISRSAADRGDPNWAILNEMYADMPDHHSTARFVDAGAAVMRDGAYTDVLPCRDDEPCADVPDPVTGLPANPVRSPDGTHFCPVTAADANGSVGGCPVWSSGAWRFGLAMAEPIVRDFELETTSDRTSPAQLIAHLA
jgi:hypothetical protein